jgi:hypothetical protein
MNGVSALLVTKRALVTEAAHSNGRAIVISSPHTEPR